MSSPLQNNIANLQELLQQVNSLPEAEGVILPELSNPASDTDLRANMEMIDEEGKVIVGTMADNGTIAATMDGIDVKSVTVPAGYTDGGIVSLDNTIDNEAAIQADLIAQIASALEDKAAGSGSSYGSCTVNFSGYSTLSKICYTKYENGILSVGISLSNTSPLTNVLCGSTILFPGAYLQAECTDGLIYSYSNFSGCVYQAPLTDGVVANVILTPD